MSNRYPLSQTYSPRTTYRVIDRSRDGEPAPRPATLPSGAPHPLAGSPIGVVTSPSRAYRVHGEGRARTWAEPGGYAVAIVEQVPAWAAAPASTVLREDPTAFDSPPASWSAPPPAGCRCGPGSPPSPAPARTCCPAGRTATRPPWRTPRPPALPWSAFRRRCKPL